MAVEYWAIEAGSESALNVALNEPSDGVSLELVDYVLADWTKPNVLIAVKRIAEADWTNATVGFDKSKWNEGRKTPFILAVISTAGQGLYRPSGLFIPSPKASVLRNG